MSDAIRQAAEECARECGISGITERIGELTDIIERAMRKLLDEILQAEHTRPRPHGGTALDFEGEIEFLKKLEARTATKEPRNG